MMDILDFEVETGSNGGINVVQIDIEQPKTTVEIETNENMDLALLNDLGNVKADLLSIYNIAKYL